ncbi:MAG: hypothetical protein NTZ05_20015 [Chloroflexi bacterium]|nr:hypothetical protein [Chloroflexota bacterium]
MSSANTERAAELEATATALFNREMAVSAAEKNIEGEKRRMQEDRIAATATVIAHTAAQTPMARPTEKKLSPEDIDRLINGPSVDYLDLLLNPDFMISDDDFLAVTKGRRRIEKEREEARRAELRSARQAMTLAERLDVLTDGMEDTAKQIQALENMLDSRVSELNDRLSTLATQVRDKR